MTFLINLLGIGLIIFTYWFFFMKKESEAVDVGDSVTITVEGGYKPDVIKVKRGRPVVLKFHRKDASSCLEEIVIPEFNVRQQLAMNEITEVVIKPSKIGEYEISCGMNMFHGKIKVEK